MARIRPLGKQVLVRPDEKRTQTDSGILLPDNVREEPHGWGKVAAVGPDVKGIQAGDRVFFSIHAGTAVGLDDVMHRLITEDHFACAVDEDEG